MRDCVNFCNECGELHHDVTYWPKCVEWFVENKEGIEPSEYFSASIGAHFFRCQKLVNDAETIIPVDNVRLRLKDRRNLPAVFHSKC